MRIAYADPPYPGTASRYPEQQEVNHRLLISHLQEFDGWALSTASNNLYEVLPMCPPDVRIGSWVKTFSHTWKRPRYAWEPLLFKPARFKKSNTTYDWVKCSPKIHTRYETRFYGRKPDEFSMWMFYLLACEPEDEFVDMFPGSGAVTKAWETWRKQMPLVFKMAW